MVLLLPLLQAGNRPEEL